MEIESGGGRNGRRAFGLDDTAIVPSRHARDQDDVDISWKLGPYQFELPMLASAMDGVVSPQTAAIIGRLGGLGVLNLEGIFTRYEDADEQLERIASLPKEVATREMQDIYSEPVKPELIARRIEEIKQQKVVVAASLTPQRVRKYYEVALEAGLDVLVIQGTVVSGEHVSEVSEPLNLKEFIPTLEVPVVVGGCASYHTGLHLMRTGAAGVPRTQNGTLEEILVGPARENDGTFNLFGGLRTSMATCGHKDLAEFNRAEVVIAPALQTEGKALQRDQGVGMGATNGKAAALVND